MRALARSSLSLSCPAPEVKAMLAESGYPGMKIMQFAFDSRESGDYLPHT